MRLSFVRGWRRVTGVFAGALVAGAMVGAARPAVAQLSADQLLLVVNGNVADSVRMAEFYAKARLVPPGRICKLDLPAGEEIPFETYERNVVPQIRKFLTDNKLKDQVKCLVTFYGTPIRVGTIKIGPEEEKEIAGLRQESTQAEKQVIDEVAALERYVRSKVPDFEPAVPVVRNADGVSPGGVGGVGGVVDELAVRAEHAARALAGVLRTASDAATRDEIFDRVKRSQEALFGDASLLEKYANFELTRPGVTEDVRRQWRDRAARFEEARQTIAFATEHRYDPTQRARLRQAVKDGYGLIPYARILQRQLEYFGSDQSFAAMDSELSLLWHDFYARSRWLPNMLNYEAQGRYQGPPLLMVSRIDGPDAAAPMLLMLASLKAERDGLRGRVVIDSRGLRANPLQPDKNPYAQYDQTLRSLYDLLRTRTKLSIVFDDKEPVLPSGAVQGVALYCGWYSVGNYVPSCKFVTGAVGFHIASFEMVTLKDEKNNGWVRGLLRDGVVGTTGPVAEPYLFAFPEADEFFPLLLTGQLTLAETYFKTQKTASWQMSLVGDPLYRPYGKNPILKSEDVPEKLRRALPLVAPPVPDLQGPLDAPYRSQAGNAGAVKPEIGTESSRSAQP